MPECAKSRRLTPMRAVEVERPETQFEPFSIRIDIENRDQLEALRIATAHMCNGHGIELYDLLEERARRCRGVTACNKV
jgi:hypothetical protein